MTENYSATAGIASHHTWPASHNFNDMGQRYPDIPFEVLQLHLLQTAVVTNVVAHLVLVDVITCRSIAATASKSFKGLQYGTIIPLRAISLT